jgi:hypothetical protein
MHRRLHFDRLEGRRLLSTFVVANTNDAGSGSVLLDANNLSTGAGDDFHLVIPGTPIWGWEHPGAGINGFHEGLQSNCASGLCTENTHGDPNSIFAALLSQIYGSPTTADFIEIITKGPNTTGSLTSSFTVSTRALFVHGQSGQCELGRRR